MFWEHKDLLVKNEEETNNALARVKENRMQRSVDKSRNGTVY